MSYVGGKHFTRKAIVQLIGNECAALGVREVWEPFSGGLHITAELGRRWLRVHASDYSAPAVALYKALRVGFAPSPPELARNQWDQLKLSHMSGELHPLISFAGFCCSMNGIYFTAYIADRNVQRGKFRGWQRRTKACRFASVSRASYADTNPPPGSVVYCDPPYAGTDVSAYRSLPRDDRRFDSDAFWGWARARAAEGSTVLVSEYAAPVDAECIWQRSVAVSSQHHSGKTATAVERVFRIRGPQ